MIQFLEYASVLIFALSGAMAASRAQLDIIGFAFIASLTALGGGTVRDVLLDRPVFWISSPQVLGICIAAAVVVFLTAHLVESRYNWLLWLDSFALSVAVPTGVGIAVALNYTAPIIILTAIVTGTMGGLLRDVVCNEVPLVLKQGELYVSAAFGGAAAAVVAISFTPPTTTLLICAGVTWVLRAGSLYFGWRLPVYKSRPPKDR